MSRRRLLLYRVRLFRSSVTGVPPLFFFITFRYDVAAWSGITHVAPVEAQMIHFELFLSPRWYAGAISTPRPKQHTFLDWATEEQNILGIHLKKAFPQ